MQPNCSGNLIAHDTIHAAGAENGGVAQAEIIKERSIEPQSAEVETTIQARIISPSSMELKDLMSIHRSKVLDLNNNRSQRERTFDFKSRP